MVRFDISFSKGGVPLGCSSIGISVTEGAARGIKLETTGSCVDWSVLCGGTRKPDHSAPNYKFGNSVWNSIFLNNKSVEFRVEMCSVSSNGNARNNARNQGTVNTQRSRLQGQKKGR
jgi:hypothetical protein